MNPGEVEAVSVEFRKTARDLSLIGEETVFD